MRAAKKGIVTHGRTLLNILRNHMEASLDCEHVWNDFCATLPRAIDSSRFVRLNPGLNGAIPELDAKSEMAPLRRSVQQSLAQEPTVIRVAHQLVASTFYFHLLCPIEEENGSFLVQGLPHRSGIMTFPTCLSNLRQQVKYAADCRSHLVRFAGLANS